MNKKTIWITGGSTGIGKALAIKFANKGWNVAISARRENLLKEISDSNENIYGFPLDVTDKLKCKEVFEEIKITFDDWIFKQDDRVAINRATMTKFGFKVAELTVVFVKD